MWKVPLFNFVFDKKELDAVNKILHSGWLTMGEASKKFEELFSRFIGTKHAIAVSSGTTALHLANLALGIGDGDEVICPALTFVAGANSIIYTGARPVFSEITGLDDLNISPEDIGRKITSKTRAIEVMHYGGCPCDMESIEKIAKDHGLYIIEDCAHAPGAKYNGKRCGSIGDIGTFSFYSNKNMTTAEGGMITTDDDGFAEKARLMRSHGMTSQTLDRHKGRSFSYDVTELGFNYRIDEIRSAIGIVQLEKLEEANKKRRELDRAYREKLSSIKGVKLPFGKNPGTSAHHIMPVLLDKEINREEFMGYMKDKGIQTSIHYPAINRLDLYCNKLGYDNVSLPITEAVAQQEVTLPLYPSMGNKAVGYVCDSIAAYFTRRE
ncbi:MAG: DegT/DnrJ/EryC1/StrS family aminotransferase [Candidatus Omnitrophica bacterium]|nr:DegT/DnrJ/EryC1/StrS family aminotransferase [Candidatus Omnitrophota bacterium]